MKIKRSKGEIVFGWFNTLFMVFMMALMLFPMIHVLMASLSNSGQLLRTTGLVLWPKGFSFNAYYMVAKNPNIYTGYSVTLTVVVVGTFLSVLMTSLGAYVLSRKNLMWRGLFMGLIVFTMFFSGGMIPFYLVVNNLLGLGNNILALILPMAISQWNLMIMRTSFAQIPESLVESAQIDGANDFIVLFRIVIPASMSIIAVMVLFYGVSYWNAWFHAVLFIRDRALYPLQLILREILLQNNTDNMMTEVSSGSKEAVAESIKYATIVVATIPILCVYPFLQKYFVKGVLIGSVKG